MGVFLYYLPNKVPASLTRDDVHRAGLGDSLRDCLESQIAFRERLIVHHLHAGGPDGSSGVLLCAPPANGLELQQSVGYYPARQAWRQCGDFWLGHDTSDPPAPEMLARPERVSGYETLLGDGQIWNCPTIRRGGAFVNLPRAMGVDGSGQFTMRVLPAYDWAWELSGEIWDKLIAVKTFPFPEAFRLAVAAIGLNYRVGSHEATELGLITTENYESVFEAVIDGPKIKELLGEPDQDVKKNETEACSLPGPANSSPGPADG